MIDVINPDEGPSARVALELRRRQRACAGGRHPGALSTPFPSELLEELDLVSVATQRLTLERGRRAPDSDRYKWVVLSNTTLGMLMATIDTSIVLIALPDIFKGIHIDPLQPGNTFYLLWMILGFMIVTSVLVVSLGRLGDMLGRVRMYNMGFVVYTFFSLLLSSHVDVRHRRPASGSWSCASSRVSARRSSSPTRRRSSPTPSPSTSAGWRSASTRSPGSAGSFIGLILGGLLGPIQWRLIFIISVPIGLFGTVWAYLKLKEVPTKRDTHVDWTGNLTFAARSHRPHGRRSPTASSPTAATTWAGPARFVLVLLRGRTSSRSFLFARVESRSPDPMFRLSLFRIRAFTAGSISTLFSAVGRGGLMFTMVIWLQGIWLPLHGYNFSSTPLWAGIALLPLTGGFLSRGRSAGTSPTATGRDPSPWAGMVGAAVVVLLAAVPPRRLLLSGLRRAAVA